MSKRVKKQGQGGFEVSVQNLSFTPTGKPCDAILRAINFDVPASTFLAVIGGNGAGKTILLSAIAGEIKSTEGAVFVGSNEIKTPINRIIDGVGIVHQNDEDDLLHGFSIVFNVSFRQFNSGGHRNYFWAFPLSYRTDLARKFAAYSEVLKHKGLDTLVGHLAGGVRQILNLIIAIHLEHENNPCGLLLLDEHTARLDHTNAKEVMKFTSDQIRQTNATAIMVTHRYADVLEYCDQAIVMGRGKVFKHLQSLKGLAVKDLERYVEEAENAVT